ncbi:M48 family metalloprotease [Hymenobacter sp. ASUV-10]|uniref:M48 family metalloprotease n=1 Tax=Hymenobacter aranciens TaxID=3063996 RepID=A0ABT9BER8_9BACT|nr:M48 family metalloprotease [Hymenobacter sp. ASUV-10]MDO7876174.1 M48 family metalloprotease [Hymenobacter sp. ASUV-10]
MNLRSHRLLRLGALSLLLLPLGSAVNRPQQGPQPDPQVIAQFGLYQNSTLQSLIDTKGQQMNKVSDRPGNYGFTIVDSPVINAFATPDGHVYFTRGIMAHFNNEAQFAGVLGHELGHITARHGQQQQRRSTVAGIGLLLGSLASKRIASIAQPLSQGVGVLFLKYGRDDEREADQLGVKYSTKIGYDAAQMADFFNTLQRSEAQSGASSTPTFLSSHPNSADRYKTVKALAAQAKASVGNTTLAVNRNEYLRAIEGLTYGNDPRQGFVESSTFYHPDLKFQLPIPSGWKSQNSTTQFQMAEPNGRALIVLVPAAGGSLEAAAQSLSKSIGLSSAQAQKTTVNGFPAIVFQGDQVAQSGSTSARVLAYTLQDGSNYYGIVGLTAPASFATYSPQFSRVAQGFQRLTDASKLNRQPEKIRIKTASGSQTLAQALSANGVAASRQEEMAILNGMQKSDRLSSGQLFKVVSR